MNGPGVLRSRSTAGAPEVTSAELFFDLVYVFAVTQLSHYLVEHLTARGGLETLVLFMAVWWAWNYTAWATNWIDPNRTPVRVLLVALMLLSLIMSAAIPEAFGHRAGAFAGAYVAIQLLRSSFMVVAFGGERMGRNYAQLLVWSAIAGVAWIAGSYAGGDTRLVLWVGALVLDYGAPLHGFALPRLGRTSMRDWTLAGGHLAERCQLVLMIALGESILALGRTFSELHLSASVVAAFIAGFLIAVSLWWVYFVGLAEAGARAVALAADPARMARGGYAYAHAIMVAGVIVVAVAIEQTMNHPDGSTSTAIAAVILGGPAIYLAGYLLFKRSLAARVPASRWIAMGALALLVPVASAVSPLVLSGAVALLALALAVATGPPPDAERPTSSLTGAACRGGTRA